VTADKTANVGGNNIVDDYTAHLINKLAEKFYSIPENVKKFEEWHLQTYGCLPEQGGTLNG
jgi:hypothetical protein